MTIQQAQPLKSLNQQEQAVYFHSRERRRSLAGVPEMFRTRQVFGDSVMEVPSINLFAALDGANRRLDSITLKTAVRITAGAGVTGLILDMGDNEGGTAIALTAQTLIVQTGAVGTTGLTLTFDNGVAWPNGLELDIVVGIIPGTGQAELWLNGISRQRGAASAGNFGVIGWIRGTIHSFAAAQNVDTRPGVPTVAPTNFEVIEPLSVYVGQRPRQMTV